jgi:hypothetical protein
MKETLSGAVAAIRSVADLLGEAGQRIPVIDPGARVFGAGGPGRLGEMGRDLYLHWQRALDARAREAQAHAARIHDLADLVNQAAAGLTGANEVAGRPQRDANDGQIPGVV